MGSGILDKEYRLGWIRCLKHSVIQESLRTGIYPSVTMGIAILESAYGTSLLARKNYNFFGMTMPNSLIGKKSSFWDGTSYTGAGCSYKSKRVYADYSRAGKYSSGFLLSLRHFGWNFWATRQYRRNGVLNHISSGLTGSEAQSDAIQQLIELEPVYDPHPDLEGDLHYVLEVIQLIDQYDLWKFDEEFLALGGWDGTVPYHFNHNQFFLDNTHKV